MMRTDGMAGWSRAVAAIVVLGLASAAAAAPPDDDDVADREADAAPVAGPPIGEVLAAAYAAGGLDRNLSRGRIRRARLAGLVPWITVRTGRDTSWQDQDPDVDRGTTIEVRATWRLDRLVFDGHELQIASSEAARRRERRSLASRVIRAYFAWRRATGAAGGGQVAQVRTEETIAELDALTDGWFSDALARPRRGASGPRTR